MIKSIKRKPTPNIFAIGSIDLTFQLEIKKQDFDIPISSLMKTVEESQKFFKDFNLQKIQSIKDLSFLKGEKNILLNNIKIKGGNQTLNHLLLANQELKNKCIIDYIGFGPLIFEGEESFFNEIFKYVTLKNFLIINSRPLDENAKSTFAIEIKYNGETKTIYPQPSESKKDKEKNKEKYNEKKEENKIKEDLIKEYNNKKNASSNQLKPQFKRPESILNKMKLSLKKYDLIFLNYCDLKQIPPDFQMDDLFELLNFFKKNKSIIFIDFTNQPKELAKEEKDNKNKKTKEENLEEINEQNKLYDLSQIFFFDTEQAEKILIQDYEYTSPKNSKNKELLDNTKIIDYFITKISNNKANPNKTGLFLDKLDKFTVASIIKNKSDKKQYDFEFSPKSQDFVENYHKNKKTNNKNDKANKSKKDNQSTIDNEKMAKDYDKLVDTYKNIIEENKNEFSSIIISLFIHDSAYFTDSFYSFKLINETVQTSIKLIKKKIELIRKLQENPQENAQENVQDNLQQDNIQDNLDDNLEDNLQDNLQEENFQDNLENNLQEDNLEDNLEEDNLEDNLEEDNLEENEEND